MFALINILVRYLRVDFSNYTNLNEAIVFALINILVRYLRVDFTNYTNLNEAIVFALLKPKALGISIDVYRARIGSQQYKSKI